MKQTATIYIITLTFFISASAEAATLLVRQDGCGDATTINEALEMLDYNDGEPDIVWIGPGTYDEQLTLKGNAGVDSVPFPRIAQLTQDLLEQCYESHPDPLTLVGADPADPPRIILEEVSPHFYGFYPEELGDNYAPSVLLGGNDISIHGIHFTLPANHVGFLGQGTNLLFEDCGFEEPNRNHPFFIIEGNSDLSTTVNPVIAADNVIRFERCSCPKIYSDSFLEADRFISELIVRKCIAEGDGRSSLFVLRNVEHLRVEDCFFTDFYHIATIQGESEKVVFNRNMCPDGINSALDLFNAPMETIVTNNIITRYSKPIEADFDSPATPGRTLSVVNNTFQEYFHTGIEIEGNDPGTVILANNIFSGDGGSTAINLASVPSASASLYSNLYFNNQSDLVDAFEIHAEVGKVTGDPMFNLLLLPPPPTPGAIRDVGFTPVPDSLVVDAGDMVAYNRVESEVGNFDVDRIGSRRDGSGIDIGAQEYNDPINPGPDPVPQPGVPGFKGLVGFGPAPTIQCTFTFTPTPTQTPTATPTFSPSHTVAPTETPTPTNPAPSEPLVGIEPEAPFTFDDLICNATGSIDPDGGNVTYSYKWFRNGIDLTIENETDFSGPTVPSEETTRDEVWRCQVTVEDDEGQKETAAAQVTIQNSLPTQPEIQVLPENPLPGEGRAVLLLTFSTDADDDAVVYQFQWFRLDAEGEWQLRPEVSGTLQPYSPGEAEISGLYTAGETWKVEVTPIEARALVKRAGSKGLMGLPAGPPAIEQWIVLPDFGSDGMIDSADILTLLELYRSEDAPFAPETYPDLILISTLGWQGKAEGVK